MRKRPGTHTWLFQISVPKILRERGYGPVVTQSLETQDKGVAKRRRDLLVTYYAAEFDRLRNGQGSANLRRITIENLEKYSTHPSAITDDPLVREALALRNLSDPEAKSAIVHQRTEAIEFGMDEEDHGPDRAAMFHGIATGTYTPIDLHKESWLAAPSSRKRRSKAERTRDEGRYALKLLKAYLDKQSLPDAVESVTPETAIGFSDWLENDQGKSPKTANKILSLVSSYWRYLIRPLRLVTANPFQGTWRAVPDQDRSKKRRPFTPDEQAKLFDELTKKDNLPLLHLCAFGMLTGARLSDLTERLLASETKSQTTEDGTVIHSLHIANQKTGTDYYAPMHPLLVPIYEKLVATKGPNVPLLDTPSKVKRRYKVKKDGKFIKGKDGKEIEKDAEADLGKRFGNLKRKLFPGDRTINFHTFSRHAMSSMLSNIDCPEGIKSRIIGHSTESGKTETERTYSHYEQETLYRWICRVKIDPRVVAVLEGLGKTG